MKVAPAIANRSPGVSSPIGPSIASAASATNATGTSRDSVTDNVSGWSHANPDSGVRQRFNNAGAITSAIKWCRSVAPNRIWCVRPGRTGSVHWNSIGRPPRLSTNSPPVQPVRSSSTTVR